MLIKICDQQDCHFIYLDKEFSRYCFYCVYSNFLDNIMFNKIVHFRQVVQTIKKYLDVIRKLLEEWTKLHEIGKLVKPKKFLTLTLDILNRRLILLSEEDDAILMQNLLCFFADFKFLFGNVYIEKNSICSDLLSNIQQYICSKIVKYVLQDLDLEYYFNENQILVIDYTHIKKLEVDDKNYNQENYQPSTEIMYYCHKSKRYFRECWRLEGNYFKFAEICCRYFKFCSRINLQTLSYQNQQRQLDQEYIFIETQFKQNQAIQNQKYVKLNTTDKALIQYGDLKDSECQLQNNIIIYQVDQLKTFEQQQPIKKEQQQANNIQDVFLNINIKLRYRKGINFLFLISINHVQITNIFSTTLQIYHMSLNVNMNMKIQDVLFTTILNLLMITIQLCLMSLKRQV